MSDEDREYLDDALEHGFSESQAEFLTRRVSRPGHSHSVDQIEDFDDAVLDTVDEYLDEDND